MAVFAPPSKLSRACIIPKMREILSALECSDGYFNRKEVVQLTVEGETFQYRKRNSKFPGSPALDAELKEVLFSAKEFSISTQLTPAGRLTFFGLMWNAHTERALRDVTVTFKKNSGGLFEISQAIVWSKKFLDCFQRPYADERLEYKEGKLVGRTTDLALSQIVELIKEIPEYKQRTIDVTLNVGGERISLKRGHVTPSIPEKILACVLKEHPLIIVDTKLSGVGGLSYLSLLCKLGEGLEDRRGIFYFTLTKNGFVVLRCDIYGRAPTLNNKILYTVCRSGKARSEERLSSNASIDELIDEINFVGINSESRKVRIKFEDKQFTLNVSLSTATNLEILLHQKLKELPSFYISVDVPGSIGCRELSVLNYVFNYRESDLGQRVTVLCEQGSCRGTIVRES